MKIKVELKLIILVIAGLAVIGMGYLTPRAQETAHNSRSVWDGVYTEEQAKRGEEIYSRECASCHGAELSGGEEAPALAGPGFLANWEGLSLGELSERIRVSMPPNRPTRLSRPQIADLLAHMLKVNNFPAGKTELERETEALKQIRIEATKPKANSGFD